MFGLEPLGITGKHYLKSPDNSVGIPPITLSIDLISLNDLSIASYTYLCNNGASSMIIALTFLNTYPNILYFDMFNILSFVILIGTLNAEWTVCPFSNNVAAIPLVAVDIIIISYDKKYVIILFNKKDFPIPPGPSKKVIPSY